MNFLLTFITKLLLLNKPLVILSAMKEAEDTIRGEDKGLARIAFATYKISKALYTPPLFDKIIMELVQLEFNKHKHHLNKRIMKTPAKRRVNKWKHSQR
jgi:hypothetical protein